MRIGLVGDVMMGRAVAERIAAGRAADVWSSELRAVCNSCDLVIANLECCISARGQPTERVAGKPFFFRAPPEAITALEAAGIGAVGLANNPALDYEVEGLVDTP